MENKINYADAELAYDLAKAQELVKDIELQLKNVTSEAALTRVQTLMNYATNDRDELLKDLEQGGKWFHPSSLEDREFLRSVIVEMKADPKRSYSFYFSCGGFVANPRVKQHKETLLRILKPLINQNFTGKISVRDWNNVEQLQCWSEPKRYKRLAA